MHKKFDSQAIEKKWQESWEKDRLYEVGKRDTAKEKEYVLVEWPYPSGNLHIGHWYAFAVPDIYVRFLRMQGKQVLYPMGFDAFGLPAENAAIKRNINPREWTESNIDFMKQQLLSMGNAFSWDKTTSSTDQDYYKWTQWMFTQFFDKGIAYRGKGTVNWCPGCSTVVANEQVLPDNTCERSGDVIEKREMPQWMLKITDYADRLINDLDTLDWPEHIKEAQRQWIGRSEGAEIDFAINSSPKHYVVLHGFKGAPDEVFIPWLKSELEKYGHSVETPTLPNANNPTEEEQVAYVLENCTFTENTVVIGHSLGAAVALKIAERLPQKLAKLVLVAGFLTPEFKDNERNFTNTFSWSFDVEAIKNSVGEIVVLSAHNDSAVDLEHGKKLSAALSAKLIEFTAEADHVCGQVEPVVLKNALDTVTVFTTRPDTLYGATYMVLAPEHALVQTNKANIQNWAEVEAYIVAAKQTDEQDRLNTNKEKTGVKLEGITATNPASGEEIPVYIADYVLASYGTGAIMAVPAHDERDYAFAKKFGIEIKQVIARQIGERITGAKKRLGVSAFIRNKDGKILIQTHKHERGVLRSLPGGGVEDRENLREALRREIIEETGYTDFEVEDCFGVYEYNFNSPERGYERCLTEYLFTATLLSGRNEGRKLTEKEKDIIGEDEWVSDYEAVTLLKASTDFCGYPEGLILEHGQFTGNGVLIDSDEFNGMNSEEAKVKIVEKVGGRMTNTYRLRDWSVGRQRYWGVPIPIVYDPEGKPHTVPAEHLPWTLPEDVDFKPTGEPPLAKSKELLERTEKIFGRGWKPEVETLDTFVDSSWYFLRYIDNQNTAEVVSTEAQNDWMQVNMYFGGAEHTTMHLLYSRFWQKVLFDMDIALHSEPYLRRINRGLILGPDGNKMSKSKGNVIDPDEQVKLVGADAVKMYLAFMGPYEGNNYPWDTGGVAGLRRFLERVNGLSDHLIEVDTPTLSKQLHKTIKKLSTDIPEFKFNTAISALMIFINQAEKDGLTKESYEIFLKLLAPFAPHLTEELWHEIGNTGSIHVELFPSYDESLVEDAEVVIGVQINGKVRGDISLSKEASEAAALAAAEAEPNIKKWLDTGSLKKVIYKPGRILNLIIN